MSMLQSPPGEDPVVVESLFQAPLQRVYRAWTDPEQLMAWFGPAPRYMISANVDLRPGGKWRFVMTENTDGRTCLHGEYLEVEPDARISFSWRFLRENTDGTQEETDPSKVTVTFRAEGAATHVRLLHENIATEDARLGVGRGWGACLGNLVGWLEAGDG
jgi:uncharacterized protein YndB with AHSA1/START domain